MTYDDVYARTRNLRALYVEDEADLMKSTRSLLENYFQKVDVAKNGRKGLDVYQSALQDMPYDVVITDINMPGLDGIEMAKEMKNLRDEQIILFLSAHHEEEYLKEAAKIGNAHYLYKPVKLDALNRALFHAIEGSVD